MHLALPLLLAGVATAAVSRDGTCGGSKRYTCPSGSCCSRYGWCGITSAYCGGGCQSTYGKCGVLPSTTLKTSTTTGKTSTSSKPSTTTQKSTTSSTSTTKQTTSTSTSKSTSTTSKSSSTSRATTTTSHTSSTATSTKTSTTSGSVQTSSSTLPTTSKTTSASSTASTSAQTTTTATSSVASTTSTSSAASSASGTPTPNNGKRGLAYNDATLTQPFSLSGQDSKVSWAWNWASSPSPNKAGAFNAALKFVPMLWSDAWSLTSVWTDNIADAKANAGADSLLAFNEPDNCGGQACMVVPQAVHAYKTWLQPHAGAFKLGAPAVSNAQTAGEGLDWLAAFLGNCTGCAVDFLPLHYHSSRSPGVSLQAFVQAAHARFPGKPLWLAEYALSGAGPAEVRAWLREVVPWLDAQSYVQRHAFFMDTPGDTFLINANGSGMNEIGEYYNSGS